MKLCSGTLLASLLLVSSVDSQYRRVFRKYPDSNLNTSGSGFRRRVKKVKSIPQRTEQEKEIEREKSVSTEAASERLLNPFSLFNLVRFPNTACTTDRGESPQL